VEIELDAVGEPLRARLQEIPQVTLGSLNGRVLVTVQGEAGVTDVLKAALESGASVGSVTPRRETLEDLFVRKAIGARALER
jgi:ABC-2 type transport system ATP-binding protein